MWAIMELFGMRRMYSNHGTVSYGNEYPTYQHEKCYSTAYDLTSELLMICQGNFIDIEQIVSVSLHRWSNSEGYV